MCTSLHSGLSRPICCCCCRARCAAAAAVVLLLLMRCCPWCSWITPAPRARTILMKFWCDAVPDALPLPMLHGPRLDAKRLEHLMVFSNSKISFQLVCWQCRAFLRFISRDGCFRDFVLFFNLKGALGTFAPSSIVIHINLVETLNGRLNRRPSFDWGLRSVSVEGVVRESRQGRRGQTGIICSNCSIIFNAAAVRRCEIASVKINGDLFPRWHYLQRKSYESWALVGGRTTGAMINDAFAIVLSIYKRFVFPPLPWALNINFWSKKGSYKNAKLNLCLRKGHVRILADCRVPGIRV